MKKVTEEMKARVRELYVPGTFGMSDVAREVGLSKTHVKYILDPVYAERQRRLSREAKRRRTGVCQRCGGETKYNGHRERKVSRLCDSCSRILQAEARVWTREAVIEAIQIWARLHDGVPPTSNDWVRSGDYHPSRSSVYRARGSSPFNPFAKWADAIEAAGFPRPGFGKVGERPHIWTFDHDEALRLLDEGVSQTEVAERMGVAFGTIHKLKNLRSFSVAGHPE